MADEVNDKELSDLLEGEFHFFFYLIEYMTRIGFGVLSADES